MTNAELRITLENLYRIQLDLKNIFKHLDENTDRDFSPLNSSVENIGQSIGEVQELIIDQCDECGNIGEHDEQCSIGRQERIEQAEMKADEKKEDAWTTAQQNKEGKI